ncbi:MAG: helix-turn-helix domain-containing protein [Gammaproteobacteria bacterium]|nr:helix-turn-helix domain-containing protein [Gammaproteobacteria bacterium]
MAFDSAPYCAAGTKPNCAPCPASRRCLPCGVPEREAALWNASLLPHLPVSGAGKALFEAGSPADSVFSVRAGCLKSFTVDEDGNERVQGFFLPGDLVGLDALGNERYVASVVSVAPSQVCRIPKTQLQAVLAQAPHLTQQLLRRLSRKLAQAQALAGAFTADQRVAAFLLLMEERLAPAPGTAIRLPMTRRDIANYLRLATETVCRVLARFELRGWLHLADKTVRIDDAEALHALAAPIGLTQAPSDDARRTAAALPLAA